VARSELLVSATVEAEHQLLFSSSHKKSRPCKIENAEYISTQMDSFTIWESIKKLLTNISCYCQLVI
jgi:hypothetical protein